MAPDIAQELQRLAAERSTGVLRTRDGAFHLADGAIAAADCRRTPGLDRLAVEAGVATSEEWQRAVAGETGRMLERPQLEALALLSVFDAAYFLLSAADVPEFQPGPAHWLAAVCRVTPSALIRECARRGEPESGPWPAELVSRVPVVPVRRVRRRRVVLTGGHAEVLAAADSRRSITEIARDLGRTAYGCLEAVRDLTAAGLIEPPATTAGSAAARTGAPDAPLLHRRRRPAVAIPAPDQWEPVDHDLLVRVRAALEELA
ncbi:hypothetical protein [Nocardia donostiensis]|uniref:Uncharacterized protein n=1 Tax=Nocardia donostiensis TaxID=1538463 RepID=A0A1W0B2Z0_9NOCA|nr:hypothetical protein [Nocardia donostiensis]ONM48668.1 hypothetical protein B0T46_11570 [Nocardia donostiensis]OQS16857.1 hypothetical protein B0T36_04245 [Nocardia donostiensis]OQS23322.1 hypothetical protein B0T44_03570 [Nocardia donostiensis]